MILCVLKKIGRKAWRSTSKIAGLLGAFVILLACFAIPFFAAVAIMMLATGFNLEVSSRAVALLILLLLLWLLVAKVIQDLLEELKVIVEECKSEKEKRT